MTKKKLIGCIIGAVCFVAILLVATFYDLEINKALGNADSVFGQFFRLFGELTGWIVIPFATAFLFQVTVRRNKIAVVISVFWAIATFVGWFLTVKYILGEFTGASYADGFYASRTERCFCTTLFLLCYSLRGLCTVRPRSPKKTNTNWLCWPRPF